MNAYRQLRYWSVPALVAAAFVVFTAGASTCSAGILLPEQVSFDANDLDESLSGRHEDGGMSSPRDPQKWPLEDSDQQPTPKGYLTASLPTGNSSSGSSSSTSSSSVPGTSVTVGLLSATIAVADDLALSQLAEDHGLSLPDPPGTDLLRPPQFFSM